MTKLTLTLQLAGLSAFLFAQDSTRTVVDSINWNVISANRNNFDNIPVISLSESEIESDANTQNVSGILTSSRDVFQSAASYQLSNGGFRYRGYGSENTTLLINGTPMNNPDNGSLYWSEWGGLNDMFRSQQTTVGLAASTFSFGNLGGAMAFDSRAGHLFKGLNVGYAITNQRYRNRINASYVSGFLKDNWAIALAFSKRWAEHGYEPGTWYDGYSFFVSVEKLIRVNHSISLTAFGAPTKYARAAYSTAAFQQLADDNYYNPAWGMQNGKMRNANISNSFQPIAILMYEGKISAKTSLISSVSWQLGVSRYSGFDWYNAQSPLPDYYSKNPALITDSAQREAVIAAYENNPDLLQIQWDDIYNINRAAYDSVPNANGGGQTLYGNWSKYVLSDRVEENREAQFNFIVNHRFNDIVSFSGGLSYQFSRRHFYKQLKDLLGGDFYVNFNSFAEMDFVGDTAHQYNVEKMNGIVKTGDVYGYDYYATLHKGAAWAQWNFSFNRVEFFVAGNISDNYFWRTGNFLNGLFLHDSKGDSKKINSLNYGFKSGAQLKIDGRNYLYANALFQTVAPNFNDAFLAPQLRNDILPNLKNQKQFGIEWGYVLRAPKVQLKANLFYTEFRDGIDTYTYWSDIYNTMVNYSLNGINKRHLGAELGFDYDIWKGIGVNAVANVAKYSYTSRPAAYITKNNDSRVLSEKTTIYWQNFNLGGTPQMAYSLGIRYRSPKYWNVGVNVNYFDWNYVAVSPARRTSDAMVNATPHSETWNAIVNQEKLKGQWTLDFRAGYSWFLNKTFKFHHKQRFYIIINGTVSNLTNNKSIVLYANEQLRFDYDEKNIDKFATKYKYARGIGYFVSVAFRMQ